MAPTFEHYVGKVGSGKNCRNCKYWDGECTHKRHKNTDIERVCLMYRYENNTCTNQYNPTTHLNKVIGTRIKIAMERSELTANELSAVLGVTEQAVYNWFRGLRRPSKDMLQKLSKILLEEESFLAGVA